MPPTDAPPPQEFQIARPIDFRGFYYTMRERAWILALCCLVAAFATAAYLLRTPKIYASKVVLQVEQEEAKIINIQRVQQEDLQTLEFLKTVEQTLQNRTLLERVIATNQLANDPGFLPRGSGQRSSEQLVTKLSKMVEVKLRKGTRLIDVKVEHPRPELTALIANSLVKEYIRQCYENNFAASEIAKDYLVNEATGLKRKLEESENALQAYREQAQSISFEDRQNIVVEKLKELSVKATEASSQRIVHETAWKQVQALGTNLNALLLLPAVASDPRISEIRANLGRQESEVATLKQRYLERHPKLIQAQSQLAEWKNALEKAVLGVPETIRSAYESSKAAERALEQALREQETLALDLNKQTIRYQSLAREVESDRTLYASVLNRMKETSLTKDLKLSKIRIVQQRRSPYAQPDLERRHPLVGGRIVPHPADCPLDAGPERGPQSVSVHQRCAGGGQDLLFHQLRPDSGPARLAHAGDRLRFAPPDGRKDADEQQQARLRTDRLSDWPKDLPGGRARDGDRKPLLYSGRQRCAEPRRIARQNRHRCLGR